MSIFDDIKAAAEKTMNIARIINNTIEIEERRSKQSNWKNRKEMKDFKEWEKKNHKSFLDLLGW